jgi:hypothetical protein
MTAGDVHFFMEKPTAFNPAASMAPVIPPLTHEDVEAITQYLLTLDPAQRWIRQNGETGGIEEIGEIGETTKGVGGR